VAKIQLVSAYINLSGSNENVVFRGGAEAITFPESLVLAAIHGGAENVHDVVVQGFTDRSIAEEHRRLTEIYGDVVSKVFPTVGGTAMMQLTDDQLPTQEEVEAGAAAQAEATAKVRKARTAKATPTPTPAAAAPVNEDMPSLDDMPQ